MRNIRGQYPMETTFFRSFPKKFEFVSLCSFICLLQAVYQLSGPVCKATWSGCPSFLTFTSRFVIDFLFIRKVIIFSAITTNKRHPCGHVLYTKMLVSLKFRPLDARTHALLWPSCSGLWSELKFRLPDQTTTEIPKHYRQCA